MSYEARQGLRWVQAAVIVAVIVIVCSCSGCASTGARWSAANTAAELAYQTTNVVDAMQTAQIQDRADVREGNAVTRAVIGEKPSTRDTALYFASLGVSHYLISMALPPKWRAWFQGATLAGSTLNVANNCSEHGLLCGGAK
jgi:hypothetical protein